MSLLVIEDLVGGYPGTRVLNGVDLAVDEGHVLTLLGRNGVGKTTLIHTVMGMLGGTGSVRFRGEELLGRATHKISRLGIGLVPQGRRVFGPLTVGENLRLAARSSGLGPWTVAKVYDLFPGLHVRRKNFAAQLSGGEQEMLSIGRALVTNPQLLLMDEPSDGLAPAIIDGVGQVVETLAREGTTIVLVEQNLALGLKVADHVAVMSKGSITYTGKPDHLRENPQQVRDLLGVGAA